MCLTLAGKNNKTVLSGGAVGQSGSERSWQDMSGKSLVLARPDPQVHWNAAQWLSPPFRV